MPIDLALRSGAAIESTFLSVQARARGSAFFSAGMLARNNDGTVPWTVARDQALRIRSDLERNLAHVGLALSDVVTADIHLVPSDPWAEDLVGAIGLAHCAVRAFTVSALNRPEYLLEVAVMADGMTQDRAAVENPGAIVPVGVAGRWADGALHLAGHCDGLGSGVDLPTRYEKVLRSVLDTLAIAGLGPDDLMQTTTHVLEPPTSDDLGAIGGIRRRLLDAELPPAGTMITVTGLPCEASGVQIHGVAVRRPQ
jgi:enamine deaminase RidA (YjgF/YER057c/UK114 family)